MRLRKAASTLLFILAATAIITFSDVYKQNRIDIDYRDHIENSGTEAIEEGVGRTGAGALALEI